MKKRIALISDLHIGSSARGKDLQVPPEKNYIEENYVDRFKEFIDQKKIDADYLFITGDITNTATFEEYRLASETIIKISETLNVDMHCVFFSPGNHDRNWSLISAATGASREDKIALSYSPLLSKENIFHTMLDRGSQFTAFERSPYLVSWENEEILVYAINTAVHDDPDDDIHFGWAHPNTIEALRTKINDLQSDSRIKIFLAHHHPIQYHDPIPEQHDFSQMQGAAELLEVLSHAKFDFFFHGHKHLPHLTQKPEQNGHSILIVGSGSFSSVIPPEWQGAVANQFHLIETHDRSPSTSLLRGTMTSWSYLAVHGWVESQPTEHSIYHRQGFGCYHNSTELFARIENILDVHLTQSQVCKWIDVINDNRDLEFVPVESIRYALDQYATNKGYEIMEKSNFEKLAIIRTL